MARQWAPVLAEAGLDHFQPLCNLEQDWVEPPNKRRGGWGGVVKVRVDPDGSLLFVKRQECQNRKTLRHPLHGRPTYYYEYRFIEKFSGRFPQLVNWACYGEETAGTCRRAVLATVGLADYRDLATLAGTESRRKLRSLMTRAAETILPLHLEGLQHGALYPVHVLVNERTGEIRLIDLERARCHVPPRRSARADLTQFLRRSSWLKGEWQSTGIMQPASISAMPPLTSRGEPSSGRA